ncbi:MAG: DUF2996 domain-containing protein [Cyanobacteria bacterium P01_E01_bin.42]
MAEETKPAATKKAKPPALESKPFTEFMEQHFTPKLQEAFNQSGLEDMQIAFTKQPIVLAGFDSQEECWQVEGKWQQGVCQFNLYYFDEDIKGKKGFSYTTHGAKPSTLESFMIDERRITLDLMVLYTLQRINGEKLLGRN